MSDQKNQMEEEIQYLVDLSLDLLLREYSLYRSKVTLTQVYKKLNSKVYKKDMAECQHLYDKLQKHLERVGDLQMKYGVKQTLQNLEKKPPVQKITDMISYVEVDTK